MSTEDTAVSTAMSKAVGMIREELAKGTAVKMANLLRDKVALQKQLSAVTKDIMELDTALEAELRAFSPNS